MEKFQVKIEGTIEAEDLDHALELIGFHFKQQSLGKESNVFIEPSEILVKSEHNSHFERI